MKTLVPALRAENMAAKKERKMSKMEATREEMDEVTDDILRIWRGFFLGQVGCAVVWRNKFAQRCRTS